MTNYRIGAPASALPSSISGSFPAGASLPVAWLDRLLLACRQSSRARSASLAGQFFVDAIADVFPDCAIGICLAIPKDNGGPIVIRKLPDSSDTQDSVDPSRLFATWPYEHIAELPGDPQGSTLHIASMARLASAGPEALFIDRATQVISYMLQSTIADFAAESRTSELSSLKAQVVQSQKLAGFGQVAAGIVHELNNPLTSIIAYADQLQKKASREGGDASDIEKLGRILEAAERIRAFARDLVTYARPSSEGAAPVAIESIIDRALLFCEHVIKNSTIGVERSFVKNSQRVSGLAGQLTQVFVNLVTNACHAMSPHGGKLVVSTEIPSKDRIRIQVSDTGAGIPPEALPQIFDPFFTTKSDGRGSGLGLAIVHDIVIAHRGTIRVESEEGIGTSFTIELPTLQAGE